MQKKFVFLENIATADAAFEARGKTLAELFENAAEALTTIQIQPAGLKKIIKKKISLEAENEEKLLFAFLEELIFLKDKDLFLPKTCKIKISGMKLTAECAGETINPKKHKLGVDAKAVTYHQFSIQKKEKEWIARVVIDI